MAFRQLRYAVAATQRHPDAGRKKLPLVIPMLYSPANAARKHASSGGWAPTRRQQAELSADCCHIDTGDEI